MKPVTLARRALAAGGLILSATGAVAEPVGGQTSKAPALSQPQHTTSSNAWDSLPKMSVDRCLAEAIGTASDPKTGAPVRDATDPYTGKHLCPPVASSNESQSAR